MASAIVTASSASCGASVLSRSVAQARLRARRVALSHRSLIAISARRAALVLRLPVAVLRAPRRPLEPTTAARSSWSRPAERSLKLTTSSASCSVVGAQSVARLLWVGAEHVRVATRRRPPGAVSRHVERRATLTVDSLVEQVVTADRAPRSPCSGSEHRPARLATPERRAALLRAAWRSHDLSPVARTPHRDRMA